MIKDFKLVKRNGIGFIKRKCDDAVFQEVFDENSYRMEELPYNKSGVAIDIGAHIGTFSLRCAIEHGYHVYAYEPDYESFKLLECNLIINDANASVDCFRRAVAKNNSWRKLHIHKYHFGTAFTLDWKLRKEIDKKTGRWKEEIRSERVPCITLAQIFNYNKIHHCDILKMDCEEAEKQIFSEESKKYFTRCSSVILEWHDSDGHIYADYLKKLGFKVELTGCGQPPPKYDPTFARGMLYARKTL